MFEKNILKNQKKRIGKCVKKSKFLKNFQKKRFFSPLFSIFFGFYLVNFLNRKFRFFFEIFLKNFENFDLKKLPNKLQKIFEKVVKKIENFWKNFPKISIFFTHFSIIFSIFKNIFFDRKFRGKFEFFCSKIAIFLLEKNFRSKISKIFLQLFFSKFFLTLPPGSKDAEYRVLLETNNYFGLISIFLKKCNNNDMIWFQLSANAPFKGELRFAGFHRVFCSSTEMQPIPPALLKNLENRSI